MARFFNNGEDALCARIDALKEFSDLLFAELNRQPSKATFEAAVENLAKHLDVEVEDFHD